jgi:hypothetical protein
MYSMTILMIKELVSMLLKCMFWAWKNNAELKKMKNLPY